MWIDSHCHLNHERFDGRLPADIIGDFEEQGIDGCVSICCRISQELDILLSMADSLNGKVACTIGTHPHDAGLDAEKAISLDELVTLAQSSPHIVGIGESGLDYFYDNSPRDDQEASFRKHIQACQRTGLPLVVHARDADDDVAAILQEEYAKAPFKGVLHCFSSGEAFAMAALDIGFYISFSGIVTFKNATEIQAVAQKVPSDRILVETDAPFLAPTPFRGQTNQPSYVRHTGAFVAKLRDEDVASFAETTSRNFHRLFDRAHFS